MTDKVSHGLRAGAERGAELAEAARERGADWAQTARTRGKKAVMNDQKQFA